MRVAAHSGQRRARGPSAALALAMLGAACSHDWDSLDPRGAEPSGAGGGGTGGGGDASAGASAAGASGAGASGGGGTGAAGGTSGASGSGATGGAGSGGEGATSGDASDAGGAGGAGGATDAAGDIADTSAGAGGADASAGAGGAADAAGGSAGSAANAGSGGAAGAGGATGGASGSGDASGGTGGSAGAGGAAGTGGGPLDVEYGSTVADCVNPTAPNPDTCETITGPGELSVDLSDSATGAPHYSFLHFALDATFAGRTVVAVKLRLRTTLDANAGTSQAGEVWSVSPFTRPDLFSTVPSQITLLGASFGPVIGDQIVEWMLPTSSVQPSAPVYLGVFPTVTDGANYWNNNGAFPPRLVVTYQ